MKKKSTSRSIQPTADQLASGLIISIGEARKILSADAKDRGDDELFAEIHALNEIAQALLKVPLSSDEKLL